MRILISSPSFSANFPTNPVYLAEGLSQIGYKVDLLTTFADHPQQRRGKQFEPASATPGVGTREYGLVIAKNLGTIKDNIICWRPERNLRLDYNVALIQEDFVPLSIWLSTWAVRKGIKFIISTERYYYPTRDRVGGFCLRLLDKTLLPILRAQSLAITCHSRASYEFMDALGVSQKKLHIIPAAVNSRYIYNQVVSHRVFNEESSPGETRLLTIARLHPYKGLEYLVRAMSILVRMGLRANLTVIGSGPEQPRLRSLLTQLSLDKIVTLVSGNLTQVELIPYFARSDIYVQPSLREPFGHSVLEAMASGLPTVTTDVGGMRDTVIEGVTGLKVPVADPSALARAIYDIATSQELQLRMGRAGSARAMDYDYVSIARAYETFLSSL